MIPMARAGDFGSPTADTNTAATGLADRLSALTAVQNAAKSLSTCRPALSVLVVMEFSPAP